MITLQVHTAASAKAYARAIDRTKAFAMAAQAFSREGSGEEFDTAAAIADALLTDNGRRVKGIATRHLPSLARNVRRIVEEMQGEDPGAFCPLLALEGIAPTDAQASRIRNGRTDAELRATTYRCPVCTAADVARTLRRDGAVARDAHTRWNRRGA
jgi:hypothetical protein